MMTVWIIGLILSFLGIYLFKGSRTQDIKKTWNNPPEPGKQILRVWSLLLYVLGAVIPIFNILMGLMMIIYWAMSVYGDKCWVYSESSIANKIMLFLNKPIR